MIDSTERLITRSQDPEQQRLNYSSKKKQHTCKHLAAVYEQKRVLILSKAPEGRLHNKKLHNEEDMAGSVPTEIPIELDFGFLGVDK